MLEMLCVVFLVWHVRDFPPPCNFTIGILVLCDAACSWLFATSFSVMQPQDEAATRIEQITDVEAILDRIEGVDEVQPTPEEMEVARELQISEVPAVREIEIVPEMEAVAATTAAEYSGSALPETEEKIREEKASAKSKPVAATESESGAELH